MATLAELMTLINDGTFADKVRAAMLITAYNIKNEAPETANHAKRLAVVKGWLSDPEQYDNRVARYVIGANNALELAAITGLTDSDIKAHVDASVDIFLD
jgi:hypothetical protein